MTFGISGVRYWILSAPGDIKQELAVQEVLKNLQLYNFLRPDLVCVYSCKSCVSLVSYVLLR